jgi:hypothetical protein
MGQGRSGKILLRASAYPDTHGAKPGHDTGAATRAPTGHAGTAAAAMLPDFNFVAMNRLSPIDNGPRDCHQSLTIKDVNQG